MMHVKLSQACKPTLEHIAALVCVRFSVTFGALSGTSQLRAIVNARHTFFYLAACYTNAKLKDIGTFLNRDHTTVCHARDKIQGMLDVGDPFAEKVIPLQQLLK